MAAQALTVIGIDPGSQCLGWGVVREVSGVLSLVDCGTHRPKGEAFSERLAALFAGTGFLAARTAGLGAVRKAGQGRRGGIAQ